MPKLKTRNVHTCYSTCTYIYDSYYEQVFDQVCSHQGLTQETGNPKIFLGWAGYWVMSLLLPKPKTDLFNFEYTPSATQKFWVAEENVK